jgi:hypothetical protein
MSGSYNKDLRKSVFKKTELTNLVKNFQSLFSEGDDTMKLLGEFSKSLLDDIDSNIKKHNFLTTNSAKRICNQALERYENETLDFYPLKNLQPDIEFKKKLLSDAHKAAGYFRYFQENLSVGEDGAISSKFADIIDIISDKNIKERIDQFKDFSMVDPNNHEKDIEALDHIADMALKGLKIDQMQAILKGFEKYSNDVFQAISKRNTTMENWYSRD